MLNSIMWLRKPVWKTAFQLSACLCLHGPPVSLFIQKKQVNHFVYHLNIASQTRSQDHQVTQLIYK